MYEPRLGAAIGGADAKSHGDLTSIRQTISAIHERVHQINSRATDYADRLYGSQPQAGETGRPIAVANGAVAEILDALDNLNGAIERLSDSVSRFGNLA